MIIETKFNHPILSGENLWWSMSKLNGFPAWLQKI